MAVHETLSPQLDTRLGQLARRRCKLGKHLIIH
jgi:hypothetical protein